MGELRPFASRGKRLPPKIVGAALSLLPPGRDWLLPTSCSLSNKHLQSRQSPLKTQINISYQTEKFDY